MKKGAGAAAPAVVIGLDSLTGLQATRILSRRDVPVTGIAADLGHPCARTRSCVDIRKADTSGPGLLAFLEELEVERGPIGGGGGGGRPVLLPCTDLSVLTLSRARRRLESRFRVPVPDPDVVERLMDKGRFHAWAREAGFPVPSSVALRTRSDVLRAADSLRFPCVLKPTLKTPEWKRRSAAKAHHVAGANELLELHDRYGDFDGTLLVEEWIEGGDDAHFSCNAYFDRDSRPLVAVVTRKLRQWPPTVGEGCLSEHVENEAVRDLTLRVFGEAGHRGLAYLEVKKDARTGRYVIIEPNVGRPTGRAANAEAAGVELHYTAYCDAAGCPRPPGGGDASRPGAKWIHRRREMQAAFVQWRSGELSAGAWMRDRRGPKVDALFAWDDPVPFLADLTRTARRAARGARLRPTGRGGRTGREESAEPRFPRSTKASTAKEVSR